ncbi:hypothetical protein [Clostridium estertheticum]|nr:hypothetical protein [Clostridium estertheticum]MBU3170200.1 hypothetical protein [Clostridium estertheticum]MBZ9617020.1 hypothetical protein [Clostridium estertheticum subsp. laramiense]WAG72721.1 hypothetical protein LL032_16410 [Clostridium estertheticum]
MLNKDKFISNEQYNCLSEGVKLELLDLDIATMQYGEMIKKMREMCLNY